VGRGPGSGHGKTSTRGHKGLKARSGGGKGPGFEGGQMPLHRRLPKRGFRNPTRREFAVLNLGDVARRFPDGGEATPATLVAAGRRAPCLLKILSGGEFATTAPLVVKAHAFSKAAVRKLEAAGGRAEVIAG
jgi:large subunit ribosomal protein L15